MTKPANTSLRSRPAQAENLLRAFNSWIDWPKIIEPVDRSFYEKYETTARRRMAARDVKDWPVVATALVLNCPLWTEDQDFFGCGIATWTTNNIEVFLHGS